MNYETFATEIGKTAEAFRTDINDLGLEVYWETFEDWDTDEFVRVMKSIRIDPEAKRFPTVPEILRSRYSLKSTTFVYEHEPRFECPHCEDRGYVEIYHPIGYRPMKDGSFEYGKHLRFCTVNCWCGSGHARREKAKRVIENKHAKNMCKPDIDFDGNVMKKVTKRLPKEQYEELENFVQGDWNPRTVSTEWIP